MDLLSTNQLQIEIAGKSVCRSLDLRVTRGQRWGILGRNGIGKTTLLHTLAGIREPKQGHIKLSGEDLGKMHRRQVARKLGILFQQQPEPFPATVLETALIGRHPFIDSWRWESGEDYSIAREALSRVGLQGFESRLTSSLSGGEKQRLKIATLLVQNPDTMLLDEPTNHLDLNYQIRLLRLLEEQTISNQGALVMALHDINLAVRFCTHILLLIPNRNPVSGTPEEVLTREQLTLAYNWSIRQFRQGSVTLYYPE